MWEEVFKFGPEPKIAGYKGGGTGGVEYFWELANFTPPEI